MEQKNWSRVRQLLAYDPLGSPELLEPINRLYRELWDPLQNFFCPSVKFVAKTRIGGRYRRRYDRPQTPCDRLPQSRAVDPAAKRRLRENRRKLDPFALKEAIERALRTILAQPLHSTRPTGSLRSEAALAKAETITN
ncbi:hypothetical protein [Verrucomicrobium sp. 3C]|uniref:hypothetical protein n=1 Tax=Verrucomicrobium sp. 3C TaxID=1134055 RepID=UPI0003A2016E|nr:hypothetical protein [Verrucomicrobium sp. 3C]